VWAVWHEKPAFFANEDYEKAKEYIVIDDPVRDNYLEYLSKVLDYHVSVIENNTNKAALLFNQLKDVKSSNVILWDAVKALNTGDTETAIKIEIDAFLRYAA